MVSAGVDRLVQVRLWLAEQIRGDHRADTALAHEFADQLDVDLIDNEFRLRLPGGGEAWGIEIVDWADPFLVRVALFKLRSDALDDLHETGSRSGRLRRT